MAGQYADACKVSVQGGEGTTLQVAAGAVYIRAVPPFSTVQRRLPSRRTARLYAG